MKFTMIVLVLALTACASTKKVPTARKTPGGMLAPEECAKLCAPAKAKPTAWCDCEEQ